MFRAIFSLWRYVEPQSILHQRWSWDRAMGSQWTGGQWASSSMNSLWAASHSLATHQRSCLDRLSVVSAIWLTLQNIIKNQVSGILFAISDDYQLDMDAKRFAFLFVDIRFTLINDMSYFNYSTVNEISLGYQTINCILKTATTK